MQTLLTVAAVLICPLMMIFMMKGMHGGHENHSTHTDHGRKFNSKEDEMADLRGKIENLQVQYDELEKDLRAETNYYSQKTHS